jgi:8-oxo-dGTP diphosphatase
VLWKSLVTPRHVAIAILCDAKQRVLVALRKPESHLGGYWEFPGGKCEGDESSLDALKRECREELNIDVLDCDEFMRFNYAYDDCHVDITAWMVTRYQGPLCGHEGQALRWLTLEELSSVKFLPGNQALVAKLKTQPLPACC